MSEFLNTLKNWIIDCYDYLGLILVSSCVWFGAVLGGFAIILRTGCSNSLIILITAAAILYIFLIAPLTAGVYLMAKRIVTRDEPSLLNLFLGFKEYLTASWTLGLAQTVITLLLIGNAWFYLTHGSIGIKLLGVLFLYLLAFWAFSTAYHYPVLIEQRPGIIKTLKRSFLLTMGNSVFTAGVFFVIILLTCSCAITLLGLPLLYIGMASVFQIRALRVLFAKYGLLSDENERMPDSEAALENHDSS